MSRKNRYKDAAQKRGRGGFVALPHAVIRSREFTELSPAAIKLLLDLLSQYKGDNNGDLSVAWALMAARRWKSKDTLYRARKELLERGWVECTRQGGRHKTSLFAVSFFAIDDCLDASGRSKLDVAARGSPTGSWHRYVPDTKGARGAIEKRLTELARQPYQSRKNWPDNRTNLKAA